GQLNKDKFDLEKDIIKSELQMYKNNYREINKNRAMELFFPEQSISYEIIGTDSSLDNLSLEYVIDYYHKVYLPENITVSVVGNFTSEQKNILWINLII